MAQYEELKIDQGSDVTIELHLANIDGTKKNLTGYDVAAQMRRTINTSDSDAVTFNSIVLDPAEDGIVHLKLTNTQTDALMPKRHLFDVEISFEDSDSITYIERVLEGIIDVSPSITRV